MYLSGLALLLLTSCAQVPMASDAQDKEAKAFSTLSNKGTLYIHRHEVFGLVLAFGVTINGISVGQTAAKSYISLNLVPGLYTIESNSLTNTAQLQVKIEAGKNTFVWQEPEYVPFIGRRVALHLVDEATGREAVMQSSRIAVTIPESRFVPLGDALSTKPSDEASAIRLREVKKLRDEGLISEDEFQEKRKQLINQL